MTSLANMNPELPDTFEWFDWKCQNGTCVLMEISEKHLDHIVGSCFDRNCPDKLLIEQRRAMLEKMLGNKKCAKKTKL
jgi:hypothetical protein